MVIFFLLLRIWRGVCVLSIGSSITVPILSPLLSAIDWETSYCQWWMFDVGDVRMLKLGCRGGCGSHGELNERTKAEI
jgi:hypothetical protein